ncbi:MAG: PDZ domain-containing protein [Gemmatimonadota bacterium]|nr:PDZ domain-containing protein [Gemmatimonadota bacterium]
MLLEALIVTALLAPPPVRYEVRFPNVVHHEARISVTLEGLPPGPVEFRMSRSSPGRYAIHEFAKNVYSVEAVDGGGRALEVTRPDPYQWDVAGHDGAVTLTYTLFADRADGTYTQFDETHAHMNMPATFMWARGHEDRAIEVRFHPPAGSGWEAATQLFPTDDPWVFSAPHLQYFLDSPTELSDFDLREWQVDGPEGPQTIRLAIHHLGTETEVDSYEAWVRAVVDEQIAVFGEPPAYDVGSYTFIADYLPWASGDGMEHRNSTILSSTGSLETSAGGLIGTVSHEFFHQWNVERIRPRGLEPFDFERANMSRELWFAEGFTSYYTPLFLARAGITTPEQYARGLSGGLDFVINSPGRDFYGPAGMSMQAPFVDAATSIDPQNRGNTFISYYTYGSVLGLGLDLTLRSRFDLTLDDFMRHVWVSYGVPEIPYVVEDLERELGVFTGDPAFARDFFDRVVRGSELPDYEELLSHAGLVLRARAPEDAFLGLVQLDPGEDGMTITSGTQIGSPLYEAGLDRGDVIVSIGGLALTDDDSWQAVKAAHTPGDEVEIMYRSRGATHTGRLTFVADPRVEVVPYESVGLEISAEQRALREGWLASRAPR